MFPLFAGRGGRRRQGTTPSDAVSDSPASRVPGLDCGPSLGTEICPTTFGRRSLHETNTPQTETDVSLSGPLHTERWNTWGPHPRPTPTLVLRGTSGRTVPTVTSVTLYAGARPDTGKEAAGGSSHRTHDSVPGRDGGSHRPVDPDKGSPVCRFHTAVERAAWTGRSVPVRPPPEW